MQYGITAKEAHSSGVAAEASIISYKFPELEAYLELWTHFFRSGAPMLHAWALDLRNSVSLIL